MRRALVLIVLGCVLLAGCGGDAAGENVSAAEVVRAFEAETGHRLRVHSASSFDQLDLAPGFGRPIPRAFLREYGEFWIVVFRRGSEGDARSQVRGVEPDDRGIHWVFVRPRWLAVTVYGDNVLLNWVAGRRKHVDGRWERLDDLLEGL